MSDFYQVSVEDQTKRLRVLAVEALKHWGVTHCAPTLLKFRENAVYRVTAPDGSPAALRIHRYGYHSDAALQSELAWMAALGADGIDVPASFQRQRMRCSRLSESRKSQSPGRLTCWGGLTANLSEPLKAD